MGKFKLDRFLVLVLALIFLLALGIRVGLITINPRIAPYEGMITPMGDAARNLVEGRGYVVDGEYISSIVALINKEHALIDIQDVPPPHDEQFTPYYLLPPGTSAMLAGTYLIFGQYRYIYLRYVQAIIDSFGCLLIFLIGRELFSRRVGLISAFLYAIWLPIAYLSTWPLHDALMPFITLAALCFFILGVRRKSLVFYIFSGLAVGIGCYFQPSILLLPVMFGIGLFVYNFRKSDFRKHVVNVVKMTALMMAVVVLIISPWIARNYRVTGAVIGMRPGLWSGIWEGFGEFGDNPVGAQLSDEATYELAVKESGYNIEYLSPEYQAFFQTKVLKAIEEHPVWWTSLLAKRVPKAIFLYNENTINYTIGTLTETRLSNQTITEMIKTGSFWEFVISHPFGIFYWLPRYILLLFAMAPVLIAMFGIWVIRRNWRALALVLSVTVYFAAVHIMIFTVQSKNMMPGSLGYIILDAIALDYIYNKIKGRTAAGSELAKSTI
jgi:4-amino-4-deoxy-L-arabinose transferase-like glycosyltransferase